MTYADAIVLCNTLRSGSCRASVNAEWITFEGGRFGSHSLSLSASDKARVLAHWAGYCSANFAGSSGVAGRIEVGAKVQFQRTSFGLWSGTVVRLGVRRAPSHAPFAVVRYTRRNGSTGTHDINITALTLLRASTFGVDALSVQCPTCCAKPGRACHPYSHMERVYEARRVAGVAAAAALRVR